MEAQHEAETISEWQKNERKGGDKSRRGSKKGVNIKAGSNERGKKCVKNGVKRGGKIFRGTWIILHDINDKYMSNGHISST